MGAEPKTFLPRYGPKEIELVRKITEKTKLRKIVWDKTRNGMSANVRGKMDLVFVRAPVFFPLLGDRQWALFLVKGPLGNEILKVAPSGAGPFAVLLGEPAPLFAEVDALYAAVEEVAKADIDKAVDEIDQI